MEEEFIKSVSLYNCRNNDDTFQSLRLYFDKPREDNDYTIYTFGDIWMLRPMMFNYIKKMKDGNYDGFMWKVVTDQLGYAHTFSILKNKYLKQMIGKEKYYAQYMCAETAYMNQFSHLNLLFPDDVLRDEYFYNAKIGIGHFHTYQQKKAYLKMFENETGHKIDYDDEKLKVENSPLTNNRLIGKDLDDDVSSYKTWRD